MAEVAHQDTWDDKKIVFNDHPMSDKEIRAFLKLPSTVAATRLVAEGRVHSRWAEDVKRYKHRTESTWSIHRGEVLPVLVGLS